MYHGNKGYSPMKFSRSRMSSPPMSAQLVRGYSYTNPESVSSTDSSLRKRQRDDCDSDVEIISPSDQSRWRFSVDEESSAVPDEIKDGKLMN